MRWAASSKCSHHVVPALLQAQNNEPRDRELKQTFPLYNLISSSICYNNRDWATHQLHSLWSLSVTFCFSLSTVHRSRPLASMNIVTHAPNLSMSDQGWHLTQAQPSRIPALESEVVFGTQRGGQGKANPVCELWSLCTVLDHLP